ncbi:glycosyltransferase family 2 protein [Parabacteroides johnsonii]|uniref:glycosyltransferase family 2 protein n=1 Tax=Parabacteroides johnsonii TaxID=387661 RepID=UPI00242BB0DD|nr:glycosyltransferase family 2 protein [Parabacteroides johnsonii]
MKNPLLSIIIPVYNVEKYLRASLDSIFIQDTADCEVLLINDGSKDGSLSILREYERKYQNVRVIDKVNEGVSTTRNRGIDECRGEYFYFMDADDILHPQLLSLLRKEILEKYPDIVVWDFTTFYTNPKFVLIPSEIKTEDVQNRHQEAFNYLMANGSAVSLCSKAIRRSRVGEIIRLDPTMTYGEDMFFSWKAILVADSIRYIRCPLYYYRQSGRGATNHFHPNLYEHYRKAFDDICLFVKEQGIANVNVLASIDYHFACRIPALTSMEIKAPYSRKNQIDHLQYVLQDEYIRRGLSSSLQLSGKLFTLARNNEVSAMLKIARTDVMKTKLLYPLKKILK